MAYTDNIILLMGDSLSAGYGIEQKNAWPQLLQQRLKSNNYQLINASISGETTVNAHLRLAALLKKYHPDIVIIELGGNDGLRAYPLDKIKHNLEEMITLSLAHSAQVLLLGIRLPPNYGKRYTDRFFAIYTTLASKYNLPFVPFLLQGVASYPDLMQKDGIHPNTKAQKRLLDNVWLVLKPLL